jgi:hypothetical protein
MDPVWGKQWKSLDKLAGLRTGEFELYTDSFCFSNEYFEFRLVRPL